jgi:RHS repeat-associated protein
MQTSLEAAHSVCRERLANYDYGPFGEVIRASGPMAAFNPVCGSTKIWDRETDLLYYGYRYYNPSTGRWLSRDPLGELGFKQLGMNAKSLRDVEDERLLQEGLGYLRNKSRASFLDWLHDLAMRQDTDLEAYAKQTSAWPGDKSNILDETCNLYEYNHNDPIDRIDNYGLFSLWVPYYFACPSTTCHLFQCHGWFQPSSLPKNPVKLWACLNIADDNMLMGCAFGNYSTFSLGCDRAQACFWAFW